MITILVQLIVIILIFGVLMYAVRQIPLDHPWPNVLQVMIVVLFVVSLIYLVLPLLGPVTVR